MYVCFVLRRQLSYISSIAPRNPKLFVSLKKYIFSLNCLKLKLRFFFFCSFGFSCSHTYVCMYVRTYVCNTIPTSTQMVHGKSCVLQILLRVAADPTLTEDALVDLLMNVLADETPHPPQQQQRQPSHGKSGESAGGALAREHAVRVCMWLWDIRRPTKNNYRRECLCVFGVPYGRPGTQKSPGDRQAGLTERDASRRVCAYASRPVFRRGDWVKAGQLNPRLSRRSWSLPFLLFSISPTNRSLPASIRTQMN